MIRINLLGLKKEVARGPAEWRQSFETDWRLAA